VNRVPLKKFHVFKNPVQIRGTKEDSFQQIINQLKPDTFSSTYIEPYLIICDFGTKLTFVMKPGDKPNIFMTCNDPFYVHGTQFKNCPLAVIGNDLEDQSNVLKLKMYPYNNLTKVSPICNLKENPEHTTVSLSKKGVEISYDIFEMSANYTCIALASSASGFMRILSSPNFNAPNPTIREVEIYLEGQILKNVFAPVTTDLNRQSLYYTTQHGVYYIGKEQGLSRLRLH
jgi:hypothetical protein